MNHVSEVPFQSKIRPRSFWATIYAAGVYAMRQNSSSSTPRLFFRRKDIVGVTWRIGALSLPVARVFMPPAGPVVLWGPGLSEVKSGDPWPKVRAFLLSRQMLPRMALGVSATRLLAKYSRDQGLRAFRCASVSYKILWVALDFRLRTHL